MDNVSKLLSMQNKYQEILLKDGGLRTLCDTLARDLDSPVFILDKFRENLLYIDRELRQEEEDFYTYLNQRKMRNIKNQVFDIDHEFTDRIKKVKYSWEGQDKTEIQVKLGNDEVLGILSILLEETELNQDSYMALSQAANALSLKLHQNNLVQQLARKCSNELIENLLEGKIENKEDLVKRGELAGWDLTVSYQLYIIRFESTTIREEKKKGERSLYTYELEEKIINSLHRIIRTSFSRKYIVFSYNGDILLLIHYEEKENQIRKEGETIYRELENKFPDLSVLMAGGCYIEDCSQIPQSYQQGLHTLEFLKTTGQKRDFFFYEDLGILRLLWQLDESRLESFARENLDPLIEYEKENNTEWMESLGEYLNKGGSLQNAAKELHIHPNTMRYRINRIQEILGVDLRNFDIQLNLAIAYKIYKYILNTGEGVS